VTAGRVGSNALLGFFIMKFPFSQNDIPNWGRFMEVVRFFGFSVRVSGGMVNSHEIDASPSDFRALVEMSSSA
jgi:hypothetical protein